MKARKTLLPKFGILLLAACLLLSSLGLATASGETQPCPQHTQHNAECGYAAATEGAPCMHACEACAPAATPLNATTQPQTITAFEALVEADAAVSAPHGTALGDLQLPDKLKATVVPADGSSAGQAVDVPVKEWQAKQDTPAYDKDKGGDYLLIPAFDPGYTVADGVTLPEITVTVGGAGETASPSNEGAAPGEVPPAEITAFAALDAAVQYQNVAPGAFREALTLPDSLSATVGGKTETVAGVTWECAEYDETTGMTDFEYEWTPVLPEGYILNLGTDEWGKPVTPPSIFALVDGGGLMAPMAGGILTGSGTELDPYLIEDRADLGQINNYLGIDNKDVCFKITRDIDLGESPWGIVAVYNAFFGTLDGDNHKITNLQCYRITISGLFGQTDSATIKNLKIELARDAGVTGNDRAGGLVAWAVNTTITNCHVTGGSVEVTRGSTRQAFVGGLVGWLEGGSITNCSSADTEVKATGSWDKHGIGGLVGLADAGYRIHQCQASGAVSGESKVGGLVGAAKGEGTITQCSASGAVSGGSYVGGLVGQIEGAGADFATPPYTMVQSCYATGTVTGTKTGNFTYAGGLVGEVKNALVYMCQATGNVVGCGTVGGLAGIVRDGVVADCYAKGNVNANDAFIGGLVGAIHRGTIGGDLGRCYATGNVEGTDYVGGLLGVLNAGTIDNCFAAGNVTGKERVGGLVGGQSTDIDAAKNIKTCYAAGDVRGTNYVGGFIGVSIRRGAIQDCYATGGVSGSSSVGGFAGAQTGEGNEGAPAGTMKNCFAAGGVTGSGSTGGFIGNYAEGSITGSFFDKETTGQTAGAGGGSGTGITGKTTEEMSTPATYNGWTFGNGIWSILTKPGDDSHGYGYPCLGVSASILVTPTGSPASGTTMPDALPYTLSDSHVTLTGELGFSPEPEDPPRPGVYTYTLGTLENKLYQLRLVDGVTFTLKGAASSAQFSINNPENSYTGEPIGADIQKDPGTGTISPLGILARRAQATARPPRRPPTWGIMRCTSMLPPERSTARHRTFLRANTASQRPRPQSR